MINVTYFFILRELDSKRTAVQSQISRIAQNIATMQLLDRQDWSVYQNYISQLMAFNKDIVYIAIFDDRDILRASTLNKDLIELKQSSLDYRSEAEIVRRLDTGGVAAESQQDFRTERVNILVGDRVLGSVHVGFSLIEINRQLEYGIRLNIGLAVIFMLIFTVVSILISRHLTRPLEKLSGAMAEVARGNLKQKVEIDSRDEIGKLASTFNEMVEGLYERQVIESMGSELSSTFQLQTLSRLVRDRLCGAIGASAARIYIQNRPIPDELHEAASAGGNGSGDSAHFSISSTLKDFLRDRPEGIYTYKLPQELKNELPAIKPARPELMLPLIAKDELFGLLFFELPPQVPDFTPKQRHFASILAKQAALALENALLYEELREQERLKRELEIAREVQQKLLPVAMPEIPGFEIDGICLPAQEVGGDYFDFFAIGNNHLGIVIADVSGKGTSASFYMAEIKGLMATLSSTFTSPKKLLLQLNKKLYRHIDRHIYVTMIYGILHIPSRQFSFCRAGHNPLLHIGNNGNSQYFPSPGIGLGLESGKIFKEELKEVVLQLHPGEFVVMYTDGIVEAMDHRQHQFGDERLGEICLNNCDMSAHQLRDYILENVEQFTEKAPMNDDRTLLVLKCEG